MILYFNVLPSIVSYKARRWCNCKIWHSLQLAIHRGMIETIQVLEELWIIYFDSYNSYWFAYRSCSPHSVLKSHAGESEKILREAFAEAGNHAKLGKPSVIFIDEIDALSPRRDSRYLKNRQFFFFLPFLFLLLFEQSELLTFYVDAKVTKEKMKSVLKWTEKSLEDKISRKSSIIPYDVILPVEWLTSLIKWGNIIAKISSLLSAGTNTIYRNYVD